jgi:hypothetical protein
MGFSSIADVTTAIDNGQVWSQHYYKATPPTVVGTFTDLSWSSGTPVYNSYAASPLTFTPVININNRYVFTGPNPPAGQQKYLLSWSMRSPKNSAGSGNNYVLVDTLGFYSVIDCSSIDLQEMDNTLTLPRYTDGEGVLMAIFASLSTDALNTNATIVYTNQDGNISTLSTSLLNQTIAHSLASANVFAGTGNPRSFFVSLAPGDTGVRNIISIQLNQGIGGLAYIALVKPLAIMPTFLDVTCEKRFITETSIKMPEIPVGTGLTIYSYDYGETTSSPTIGEFTFVWG